MKRISSFFASAALLASFAFTALPANAQLQALGAVNPATGYPFWYQDTNGLALSLCLDQNGFCLLPGAFVFPANRADINATNFPGESFYYLADTSGVSPGGTIDLTLYEAAVEASFVNTVVDGGQVAFTRIRIRADVTVPGTYTIIHPYGQKTFTVTTIGNGFEINDTVDVPGLVLAPFDQNHPSLAGTPPLLPQDVGPFLRRADGIILTDPLNPNNRYIGSPGVFVPVTGSPTGNNFVQITGPTADTLQLNTFSLMGKILGLEVTPQAGADFGVWKIGSPSTAATFTVINRTGVDIPARDQADPTVGLILTPSNPVFSIVADGTCADGLTATGVTNTCTFDVVFTPTDNIASTGTISVSSSVSPAVTVPVTGTGDSIAPTLAVGQNVFTNTLTATISGTASDNVAVHDILVSLGGVSQGASTVTNGAWSFVVSGLALNAPNLFTVDAVDTALPAPGNTTTLTTTVTHDNILPVVNMTSPTVGLTRNTTPALTFNVTETNPAANTVKLDGPTLPTTPANLGPLADGPHTVIVEALDSAGNLGSASVTFTVDATPPVITVASPKPVIVNGISRIGVASPTLTFNVVDANPATANTVVRLDGIVIPNPVSGVTTLGPFTAGTAHTLNVSATDAAGNVAPITDIDFTIVFADGRISSLGATPPTISDALIALRHAVQLTTLTGDAFSHADVAPLDAVTNIPNPNGTVDISDALIILRRVVGLINTF